MNYLKNDIFSNILFKLLQDSLSFVDPISYTRTEGPGETSDEVQNKFAFKNAGYIGCKIQVKVL